jgi:aquaporin Z
MQKYLVEFLGTMFFLYVILTIGNPLAIGMALVLAIMVGGKVSGGNFNPAVSLMMTMAGRLPVKELLPYVVAQLLGGVAALQLSKVIRI